MADGAALILPVVPSAGGLAQRGARFADELLSAGGGAAHLARGAQVIENGLRGRASELRVLADMGLEKNTQKVLASEGVSIPDGLTDALSVEIKDARSVSLTTQLRIQTDAATEAGRRSLLVTGVNTCVSSPCEEAFDEVIRRTDLGPP